MIGWLMRLLGHEERDKVAERVEAKLSAASGALSASSKATEAYWDARRRELRVVDAHVDARRREKG